MISFFANQILEIVTYMRWGVQMITLFILIKFQPPSPFDPPSRGRGGGQTAISQKYYAYEENKWASANPGGQTTPPHMAARIGKK